MTKKQNAKFASPVLLGGIIQVSCVLAIIATVVIGVLAIQTSVALGSEKFSQRDAKDLQITFGMMRLVGVVQMAACSAVSYALLGWIFQSYSNLRALGVKTRFRPWVGVLLLFIPVVSLIPLYLMLHEIWRGSYTPRSKTKPDPWRVNFYYVTVLLMLASGIPYVWYYWTQIVGAEPERQVVGLLGWLMLPMVAVAIVQFVALILLIRAVNGNQVLNYKHRAFVAEATSFGLD